MKKVACILLMGGKSSRMGRDKAFLLYRGVPFWKQIVDEMKQCAPTYLSLDSMIRAPKTDCSLILDEYAEIGPMGGIYSGLLNVKEDIVFFAPCDMPIITASLIQSVIESYEETYDGVILSGRDGRCYPTLGVYSKRLLPVLEEKIKQKDYRLMGMVKSENIKVIPVEIIHIPELDLMNINTWEDYMAFESMNKKPR